MEQPAGTDRDLVNHLYETALRLMRRHRSPFVPLEVVRAELGWDPAELGQVVDVCVRDRPVVLGALVADWMFDGSRPAFGAEGARFIGIRPVGKL